MASSGSMLSGEKLGRICAFAAQLQNYERPPPKPPHPPKQLTPKDCEFLDGILEAIASIEHMTPHIEKSLNIQQHLLIIIGEYPTVKHEYQFPEPFPDKATAIYEKFDAVNWGAAEEEVSPSPTERGAISPRDIPPPNHPIFGDNGVMHGIMIRKRYCLDGRFPVKNCSVAGHNGRLVGDWWPLQICALRDGAHGKMVAGIAGSKASGAFSIVVSGNYKHLDADRGDSLYYSGSQAAKNKDPNVPIITECTEAMRVSYQLRQSVRVLRSHRGCALYSPSKGLRYDGLYSITGEETSINTCGGAYIRFHLQRDANQAALDLTRPTAEEKRLCARVQAGY